MGKLILLIISWFLPPLAIFFVNGVGKKFWLNVILTLCGWVPGIIHSTYVILTDD